MNNLGTIQATLKASIEAHPWFDGLAVIIEDGKSTEPIEAALAQTGVAVVVGLPAVVDVKDSVRGVMHAEPALWVELIFNPATNTRNMAEGVGELMLAISGAPDSSGRADFKVVSARLMEEADPGNLVWIISVTRTTRLAA